MDTVRQYLEGAVVLIAIYLIVVNADGFAKAVNSVGGVTNQSFRVLQGR